MCKGREGRAARRAAAAAAAAHAGSALYSRRWLVGLLCPCCVVPHSLPAWGVTTALRLLGNCLSCCLLCGVPNPLLLTSQPVMPPPHHHHHHRHPPPPPPTAMSPPPPPPPPSPPPQPHVQGDFGFFKIERGVNALRIEDGDCWWVGGWSLGLPKQGLGGCLGRMSGWAGGTAVPPASLPSPYQSPLPELIRLALPVSLRRYAAPTWQDEQDVRSGEKVTGRVVLRAGAAAEWGRVQRTPPTGPRPRRLLLLQIAACSACCDRARGGPPPTLRAGPPTNQTPLAQPPRLYAALCSWAPCGGFGLQLDVFNPSPTAVPSFFLPRHPAQLGTMWGIFPKDEAEAIIPEGHRRPHYKPDSGYGGAAGAHVCCCRWWWRCSCTRCWCCCRWW